MRLCLPHRCLAPPWSLLRSDSVVTTAHVCWGASLSHVPRVHHSWSPHTMGERLPLLFDPTVTRDLIIPILESKEATAWRDPWFGWGAAPGAHMSPDAPTSLSSFSLTLWRPNNSWRVTRTKLLSWFLSTPSGWRLSRNIQYAQYILKRVGLKKFFYKFIYLFIFKFLATLGLHCCTRAFYSCGKRGLLFAALRGLLTALASLVAEHGL